MKGVTARAAPMANPGFSLRSVTPGRRTIAFVGGRAGGIWADLLHGRLMLRLARIARPNVVALMPGPIWSQGAPGVPMLSWFALPSSGRLGDLMGDALSEHLASDPALGVSAD